MADSVSLMIAAIVLILVVVVFVRIARGLRRGGGSLTTSVLGATDGFLTQEKSKAAETIVNENAGKRLPQLPSSDPKDK